MYSFCSNDNDIRLIGEGGNSCIYLLEREFMGKPNAIIRVSHCLGRDRVDIALNNYQILKQNDIKTVDSLVECSFDGRAAIITENLHKDSYTYLDANAHLLSDNDKQLKALKNCIGINQKDIKEPEEERWFADNKFTDITDLELFIKSHLAFLFTISQNNIFLSYDCYFFRVNRCPVTELDYIIADFDDIQITTDDNLYEVNKGEFKTALLQFMKWFVAEDKAMQFKGVIDSLIA